MALLDVKDLRTSFFTHDGEVQAVRGVSFSVEKGETLGVVGESGSGKSVSALSLLHLLADTAKITGGQALFQGEDLLKASKTTMRGIRGGRISMIFQDPMSSLNPLIPVGRQVAEMITAHQTLDRQALRERVLALFTGVKIPEPEKRLRAYPHEFSGGMRQRVMIAMALACNPSLMIADEPTTALDVTIQSQILNLLKNIQTETGMGIIFITHDLGVVAELCNRVAVMYGGMIMETASVDALFERPAHPYTLGLLNSMPHLEMDKSQKLSPIPGSPPDMLRPPSGCPFAPRCSFVRNICLAKTPPYYQTGENHEAMCWLHDANAPKSKEENPFG